MKNGFRLFLAMLFSIGTSVSSHAAEGFVNGSFETGDYSGWTLWESGGPTWGTWGIARDGETIERHQKIWDYCDKVEAKQTSSGLPRVYQTTDGEYMSLQLQTMNEDHRMYQDILLPTNAKAITWDMFYDNKHTVFENSQQLAVYLRDSQDNILETLFVTDAVSPLQTDMATFSYDVSAYAGKLVRFDVTMKVYRNFFDAGFDNFQIVSDSQAPPGWSKGKKTGWDDRNLPPGLSRQDKTPAGFEKGEKNGWGE